MSTADTKVELVARLCDFHARLTLCFEGATGERPPSRPRSFDPLFADLDTLLDAAVALEASPNSRTEAITRIADRITRQAECLEGYAEKAGHGAKPVPSVFHSQAMHFRELADELRAMQAARPIDQQEARDWKKQPLRTAEHIAADMRAGRFPSRSSRSVAMAQIDAEAAPVQDDEDVS